MSIIFKKYILLRVIIYSIERIFLKKYDLERFLIGNSVVVCLGE